MATILIAEDNEDVSAALSRVFTRAGFEVLNASDGMAALKTAVEAHPDVILTDFEMPRLTGLELCQAIRGHHELRDIPVAILSGALLPGDWRVADAGLCAVMLKPFDNAGLVAAMQQLVTHGRHDHSLDPSPCPLAATDG